jgi:flagellar hook-associated protein 3 FlgL
MSAAIAGAGSPVLAQLFADSAGTRAQLNTITQQVASGYVSPQVAGLGAATATALSLGPALSASATYQANIAAAAGPMGVAQTALSEISSIASNFYAQTNNLNGLDAGAVDSIAASARGALAQVANLLDSRDGNNYVFAGQDSTNAPVPNPDNIGSSGFATAIAVAVAGLGTNGATATIASTLAIASSNAAGTSPFSAALNNAASSWADLRTLTQTANGTYVHSSIVANSNADVASAGAATTGSYTRDILRALATLGSLSSSQLSGSGFPTLVGDVRTSLGNAITALNQDAGVMGDRQTAMQASSAELSGAATAMQAQLSAAEDVDTAAAMTRLSTLQTQLQASYQMIAAEQGLSLVKYLPLGG